MSLWGELWTDNLGPQPNECDPCNNGDHTAHTAFIHVQVDGTTYGPLTCDCLCDPVNVEALLAGEMENPQ